MKQSRIFRNAGLVAITALVTASAFAAPSAKAYQSHEHPFVRLPDLAHMSQAEGDRACRNAFGVGLRLSDREYEYYSHGRRRTVRDRAITSMKDGTYLTSELVNHVWAHMDNRECIANRD
ncbi:MAG: hypothetical protein AAFP09_00895 [Cyanobacteria bacterium J06607_10]